MAKNDMEISENELESSTKRNRSSSRCIPERVAQFYYFLGLFCSTYSSIIITAVITFVLICCYPLLSLPLPGNRPQYFSTPYENYSLPPLNPSNGDTDVIWPRWYRDSPTVFIQQIIVKSSVLPWNENLILTDAFRGPLYGSFGFLNILKNSQQTNTSSRLDEVCFKIGEVKSKALKGKYAMLPEHNCLIVSPANFWEGNSIKFQEDPDILGTILNYRSHQKGKSGLAELLLGMNVKETGLKKYPFRSRQRIVSYAVTIVFQRFDSEFIGHLRSSLYKTFPPKLPSEFSSKAEEELSTGNNSTSKLSLSETESQKIVHIFYPSQSSLLELIPLVCTYIAMFIYVYFSIKKVEMIKSKLGIAFSAVITVVASLCMSLGLCSHVGMSYEVNCKAIFPYLVVVIGLENILVLTRSVVSMASHLDVKIRVAQGLSKEGWSITKNLCAEVTILTIGFFTFIPKIQEFCILAVVGLLSDFFLQTFFFATVLSIDIRRTEFSTTSKHHSSPYAPFRTPVHPTLSRVKSNSCFTNGSIGNQKKNSSGTVSVVAPSKSTPILVKLPKRVRLVYFWAQTRFFQRTFIIFMVGWISYIIYESGIVAHFNYETEDVVIPMEINRSSSSHQISLSLSHGSRQDSYVVNRTLLMSTASKYNEKSTIEKEDAESLLKLKEVKRQNYKLEKELYEPNPHSWRRLSQFHWQALLGVYNISLSGKYMSILPPICLSIPVDPNTASSLRHPHEHEQAKKFNWQALSNAFEPIDFVDEYDTNIPSVTVTPNGKVENLGFFHSWEEGREIPYIPTSPIELALTMLFAIPSIIFIIYTIVVFYKCICSRNYAEWRSSWMNKLETTQEYYTEVVFEAVPLILDGHAEEVECMGNDGNVIASVCLSGVLKIWNANTGDNILSVNRKRYFEQLPCQNDIEDVNVVLGSDGESILGSSPPGTNGLFMNGTNQNSINNISLENRPSQFNIRPSGRRLSQTQFSIQNLYQIQHQQGSQTPDSPNNNTFSVNSVTLTSTPPSNSSPFVSQAQQQQFQHRRNCSVSSSYSIGGGNGAVVQQSFKLQQQSYEITNPIIIQSHRRTSSFPSQGQVIPNPSGNFYGQTQPIPISPKEVTSSSSIFPYSKMSEMIPQNSNHLDQFNNSGNNFEQMYFNNSTNGNYGNSIRPESRVGSPLDKIREGNFKGEDVPPVWCLDCKENLVILGTGTGRIEIWDSYTGYLKCTYEDNSGGGVMCLKLIGNRLVTARINGSLDFLEIESTLHGQGGDSPSLYHRWNVGNSENGENRTSMYSLDSEIRCVWLTTLKAHQQPITCLDSEGGRILTGSQDHCLKVFRLEDHLPFYTLHGHYGPITCLFIDKISPMTSGSGSQDGMLCVWDLMTGLCMYSTQAHDGPISALTYSASYIISAGGDNKICVWERFQGHLLKTIQLNHTYCSSLVMLTHNLLITSKQGSLVVWDVRSGDIVRVVRLGHRDNTVFVRQVMDCADGILCDYGSQLRLVRFPSIITKLD